MSPTVKLAEYLFTRLQQLGVQSIHGVPGDYNLPLLDYVESQGLHWVGNCNELNAGYATDGYSRIKGLGALVTTFGVGELSAINAIAGAYAELAPVVHIVGTPGRVHQDARAPLHHTLNDGQYDHFAKMHEHVTVAQAILSDPRTCPQIIDSTIQQCLIHSRPVYIAVPADMVSLPVAAERLQSTLELPATVTSHDEAAALELVLNRMYTSERPMILVDGESRAYGILEEIEQLIKTTNWPTWTSIFGKGLVDESLSNAHGIWLGAGAGKETKDYVSSCDLILCFGSHWSSTNTETFRSIPDPYVRVLFKATTVEAGAETFRDLHARHFLSKLVSTLDKSKLSSDRIHFAETDHPIASVSAPHDLVTHELFYLRFNRFLRPGDIVLGETGMASYGCRNLRLHAHARMLLPSTWLSIGYMLPAAQGAAVAQRELHARGRWCQSQPQRHPRTILFIGDGSFQMTVQELSTIIREKLNVLVILINNDGYSIERFIHGWDRTYNDVASWRYLQAPAFFGANNSQQAGYHTQTFTVRTWEDFERCFGHEDETHEPMLKMVEVMMDREDGTPFWKDRLRQQKEAAKADTQNNA